MFSVLYQGSIAHVCSVVEQQQQPLQSHLSVLFCILLVISVILNIHPIFRQSDHTIIVSQYNTDYNMIQKTELRSYLSKVQCANGASLEANS